MLEIVLLIIVGSIAYRGSSYLVYYARQGDAVFHVPLPFLRPVGRAVTTYYMLASIPLAAVAGFLLHGSWAEAFIVAGGTWGGMLLVNLFVRFNAAIQFMLFGFINLLWLAVNVIRRISG